MWWQRQDDAAGISAAATASKLFPPQPALLAKMRLEHKKDLEHSDFAHRSVVASLLPPSSV